MKTPGLLLLVLIALALGSCGRDDGLSDKFGWLTSGEWVSDSLLVNGVDAGGEGQMLEDFKGTLKFNKDGTGNFGQYSGTWKFASKETELVITTQALQFPLTTKIAELTAGSLKITTVFPDFEDPEGDELYIRMTFVRMQVKNL